MEQKIQLVSLNEIIEIKRKIKNESSVFFAEINENDEIQTLDCYLAAMNRIFNFPIPAKGLDGYNDWITDLDWLDKEGYVLVIYNFETFINKDLEARKKVIYGLIDNILPFWNKKVLETVVEGKPKTFIVYLVC